MRAGPLTSALGLLGLLGAAIVGLERLKRYVYAQPAYDPPVKVELAAGAGMDWLDQEGWRQRIISAVQLPKQRKWGDADLLHEVARQMELSGWVSGVQRVSKEMDGTVRVACNFRRPIAMIFIRQGLRNKELPEGFIPIDFQGVRLPEEYGHIEADAGWMRVFGVQTPPPQIGKPYPDKTDAAAAVRLAGLLFQQAFAEKISLIDVSNYQGRRDRSKNHIILRTRLGGEIIWGSAIGEECEELSPADKIRNIALFLEKGSPQAHAQIHLLPNEWREYQPPVVQTADNSTAKGGQAGHHRP